MKNQTKENLLSNHASTRKLQVWAPDLEVGDKLIRRQRKKRAHWRDVEGTITGISSAPCSHIYIKTDAKKAYHEYVGENEDLQSSFIIIRELKRL